MTRARAIATAIVLSVIVGAAPTLAGQQVYIYSVVHPFYGKIGTLTDTINRSPEVMRIDFASAHCGGAAGHRRLSRRIRHHRDHARRSAGLAAKCHRERRPAPRSARRGSRRPVRGECDGRFIHRSGNHRTFRPVGPQAHRRGDHEFTRPRAGSSTCTFPAATTRRFP